ncbi:MAG: DUF899 family protein [Armatimonadetes bacterium]|nr:DUF899 family protein [Armatimonadota bacterium]
MIRFPQETPEYRAARDRLLESERALRDQVERVAEQRRALPLGGRVKQDYTFEAASGPVPMASLFSRHDTLMLYNFMFGPDADRPCPMCSSFIDGLNAMAPALSERLELAVVAKSPIERIQKVARERGWDRLRLLSSGGNTYNADYFGEACDGRPGQMPMLNVFVRRNSTIHHYWGTELLYAEGEGEPRHLDLAWPLWNLLDMTPDGRGNDWYPSLSYPGTSVRVE